MCAACVAQGIAYVGGALGGLQVMAAHARRSRVTGATKATANALRAPHVDSSAVAADRPEVAVVRHGRCRGAAVEPELQPRSGP